jgi:pyruvate dehydrogenase E1 component alpha subunit
MPRKEIDLAERVEYLSILDEGGSLDKDLEPDIPEALLLRLHRAMLLGRRFDERMLNLQRQGRIGTFGPIKGQEAAQIGAVAPLESHDWLVPSFRETGAQIWRGVSMEAFLIYYGGFDESFGVSEDKNSLPNAVPVATQLPYAVGIGWAMRYREKKEVVMAFFGDGATSQGDFHEALNFAGAWQTPVVFVCQNNQWAISVPRSKQTRSKTLAQKALAYAVPGIQVDGNDVLAVYVAAKEAVERARSGGGPTMIECVTYRMSVHTTADDPKRYRSDEEVAEWEKRDPIIRFQKYLKEKDLLSDDKVKSLEEEIKVEIQGAVDRAEEKMKGLTDPLHMFEHTYAELTPTLQQQKKELGEDLRAQKEETNA